MADVRPLRGVHYDRSLVGDLGAVICPPYDIISPQQQQELYERSPYNFIRIEYTRETPSTSESKYERAATTLDQWLTQGILKTDDVPAVYIHDQHFLHEGKELTRRGLIAVVKLEDWSKMVVRPHEGTLSQPKSDRLNLLRKLQTNTSPILALYQDTDRRIASILSGLEKKKPALSIKSPNGEGHVVWAVTDQETINVVHGALADQPLYIADGHHRYESALNYCRERRAAESSSAERPFDFVMMTLVDFDDPGLVILPAHRMVRGLPASTLNDLKMKLPVFFDIQEIPLGNGDTWQRVDAFLSAASEPRLVAFGLSRDNLTALTLRNFAAADRLISGQHSKEYRRLDVSILDHVVLEKLLGITREREENYLSFIYEKREAVSRVQSGDFQLTFLLSAVKPSVIKAIADVSDRMPRKSTYFYPKLPSGLVFYRLV